MSRVAVIQYPGSNCDLDALEVLQKVEKTKAGLLPGAILRNTGLRFVCTSTRLRVETTRTPFTTLAQKGQTLRIPIAHNEGRYYLDSNEIRELERNAQIVMRYVNEANEPTED